ncbi:MAG TPA: MFS transporter [Caulobacteraceae bacterium]|nr:MFS transporter [Caulobacteraceae bacterium]
MDFGYASPLEGSRMRQLNTAGKPTHVAWAIAVCCAIGALEGYDIQAVGVSAPAMAPALHMPEAFIGYASSLTMAGLILGAVVGGWAADRFGRKPVLVASAALFGVFTVLTALVQTSNELFVLRTLTGLGLGGAMPNMIAMGAEISAPERRSATITGIFSGFPAGGAVASLLTLAVLAGVLPKSFDWRLVYLVGGALAIALVPVALMTLPETRPARTGERRNVLTVLFGEGRAAPTLLLCLAFACTTVLLYLMVGWLPTLVVGEGLSRVDAALAALSFNVTSTAGGVAIGIAVDRFGLRRAALASYIGLVLAMGALAATSAFAAILVFAGLAGFFAVGAQFALYAASPTYYPPSARALGVGAAVGAGRVGSIIGPTLGGVLRAAHASSNQVLLATLPVILMGGVAAVALTFVGRAAHETEPDGGGDRDAGAEAELRML